MSDKAETPPLPPADFAFFCYSLATQASVHLGALPNPVTEKTERDLVQAKYTIDLLEMLKRKTEGNLTDDERKILMSLLYDLRMKYVEASKSRTAPPSGGE